MQDNFAHFASMQWAFVHSAHYHVTKRICLEGYAAKRPLKIFCQYAGKSCMQDTFARATHSAYATGRPSVARDDMVSCIQG